MLKKYTELLFFLLVYKTNWSLSNSYIYLSGDTYWYCWIHACSASCIKYPIFRRITVCDSPLSVINRWSPKHFIKYRRSKWKGFKDGHVFKEITFLLNATFRPDMLRFFLPFGGSTYHVKHRMTELYDIRMNDMILHSHFYNTLAVNVPLVC